MEDAQNAGKTGPEELATNGWSLTSAGVGNVPSFGVAEYRVRESCVDNLRAHA